MFVLSYEHVYVLQLRSVTQRAAQYVLFQPDSGAHALTLYAIATTQELTIAVEFVASLHVVLQLDSAWHHTLQQGHCTSTHLIQPVYIHSGRTIFAGLKV